MLSEVNNKDLFCDYYFQWIKVYKEGAIRKVTMDKYLMTHSWLEKLIPNVKMCEMTRVVYQQLLNDYALMHFSAWVKAYSRFASFVCRSIYSECGKEAGTRKYDNNSKNIFTYYSRA